MDTVGTTATAIRDMERERWEDVTRQLAESARDHTKTAVILERLQGKFDLHDAQIKSLLEAPAGLRANINTIIGAVMILATIGACTFGPVLGAIAGYILHAVLK